MRKKSVRFQPNPNTRWLVPLFLGILLLALIAILVVVGLSVIGLTPGY